MTSQGVIDLYHFLCGRTNWCNIIAITPCVGIWSFRQEAWKPCLVLALDHNNVNWWWRLYDLKGHSSASNHSQTVRYSKISLLAKKDLYRLKIALLTLAVYTHHIRAIYSYHRWTNKKPCRKKLLSFMLWCVPVHRSFWVLFALNALGDRESSIAPIVGVLRLKSYSHCGKARL